MFTYCLNNPVNGYDPNGMWTVAISIGLDMTLFFFGLAISLGISVDDDGNLAIQGSYCAPNYLNNNKTYYFGLADIGASGSFQWTDDDTIFDLEGPGTYIGGSAGVAQYFSADLVYSGVTADDVNSDALPNGFQINYGFGLGIDVHYRQTQTETICVIFGG